MYYYGLLTYYLSTVQLLFGVGWCWLASLLSAFSSGTSRVALDLFGSIWLVGGTGERQIL
jgi:hypothetical protein